MIETKECKKEIIIASLFNFGSWGTEGLWNGVRPPSATLNNLF